MTTLDYSFDLLFILDAKRAKIEEVLKYIEERLSELEAEKAELSEYQELDNSRRSIEYTIYAREQTSASHRLEELEEERRRAIRKNEEIEEHHYKGEQKLKELEDQLRDARQTIQLHDQEKKDLLEERNELMKVRARLELLINDLQDSQISDEEYKVNRHFEKLLSSCSLFI